MGLDSSSESGRLTPGTLFQPLRTGELLTRGDLASAFGVSRPTIASQIEELISAGLIRSSTGPAPAGGRPPAVYELDVSRWAVAVALGRASETVVALVDLRGDVLVSSRLPAEPTGGEAALNSISREIDKHVESHGLRSNQLLGIAVGVPGPIDRETGRPAVHVDSMGWEGVPVVEWFTSHYHVPSHLARAAELSAWAAHTADPLDADLIYLAADSAISAAVLTDGELRKGSGGFAGDLGHVRAAGRSDEPCRCGNLGCLNAVAGGDAIIRRLSEQGLAVSTLDDLRELIRRGNADTIQAFRRAGREIGAALAVAVGLINPSRIVLGGDLATSGAHELLAGLRETIYAQSPPQSTRQLTISVDPDPVASGIRGAANILLDNALDVDGISALLSR